MKEFKVAFLYGGRLLIREWRHFVLPFLSLVVTAVVVLLTLLLTGAGASLLSDQARELNGGDVVLESSFPIESDAFWSAAELTPERTSRQLAFTATLESEPKTSPFSVQVVDSNFPLYGKLSLASSSYVGLSQAEILLDATGASRLGVEVGDEVKFGSQSFVVKDIISSEPTSLFGGFRFLPRAIVSDQGFAQTELDLNLLRVEYIVAAALPTLTEADKERVSAVGESYEQEFDVDVAGFGQNRFQFGLQTVSDFLVIAVFITAILAAVNIYASTIYLITVERKSLAILLALGMRRRSLASVLGVALATTVASAGVVGVALAGLTFNLLSDFVAKTYYIIFPPSPLLFPVLGTISLLITITVASFVPAIMRSLAFRPRQLLIGDETKLRSGSALTTISLVTIIMLLPLSVIATWLFSSVIKGPLLVLAAAAVYVVVAVIFAWLVRALYRRRQKFAFWIRSIIAEKRADGLFGIVSFTSLFVALTALGSLTLIQASLSQFLSEDLAATVPTTYVIDVQPSQREQLLADFPDLILFSNVGARLLAIDEVAIQTELERGNPDIDQELGREFNVTARRELLASESIVSGEWGEGRVGEISVDEEFAERANIKLGSEIVFSIQGFEVTGLVTSLRSTDSRSGLPFFYFVLSPEDIGQFPSVYFGYSYYDIVTQQALGQYLAREMPNVSMLETQTFGPLLMRLVETLLLLVLIVSTPPLVIATLLTVTLVVSSYRLRRREGARLRALGATRTQVRTWYVIETITLTMAAAVTSYLTSIGVAYTSGTYALRLEQIAFFTPGLLIGLAVIVLLVALVGVVLFARDRIPLREILAYENNQ